MNHAPIPSNAHTPTDKPARYLCVGAANVDEKWRLKAAWVTGTSLPAQVHRSFGGVARNVAENLARLGCDVTLACPLAQDESDTQALLHQAHELGIHTEACLALPKQPACRYVAVLDQHGELMVGLNEMSLLDQLPSAFWQGVLAHAQQATLVLMDLNLPQAGLAACLQHWQTQASPAAVPHQAKPYVVLVAVSAPKMARLPQDLHGVDALLLNRDEWAALAALWRVDASLPVAGKPLADCALGAKLLARGLQTVVITQGAQGVLCAQSPDCQVLHFAALPAQVVDVTGAGDAFTAGFCLGWTQAPHVAKRLQRAVHVGLHLARLTLQSEQSVSPLLRPDMTFNHDLCS